MIFNQQNTTLAEYGHEVASGHEVSISAERFEDGSQVIWMCPTNFITSSTGEQVLDWTLTPADAREIAASLLLAADHADGRI